MKLPLLLGICLLGFLAVSCSNHSTVPCLEEITDLSCEETVSLKLDYDSKGRLIGLGDASISYGNDKIEVNCKNAILGYGHYIMIVFHMENNRVVSSESHCLQEIFGKKKEVNKVNHFTYDENRIVVDSKSYDFKDNTLLKSEHEIRELGDDGKLVKVTYEDTERGGGVALYKYDSNLACRANLNLQAFSYSANGLDDLLVYLLNLIEIPKINVLPDEVNYTYPNGVTHLYNENCCLDDDRLTKLEVMMNYEILISRLNFAYSESNN